MLHRYNVRLSAHCYVVLNYLWAAHVLGSISNRLSYDANNFVCVYGVVGVIILIFTH